MAVDTPNNLEKETTEKNVLRLTVEDENDKFETIKDSISHIKEIKFVGTNDDKSKEYIVETNSNEDIRKEMFSKCAELGIVILEMKKDAASLEDAFIKIVEDRPEYSEKEIEKQEYEKELEDLRQELTEKQEAKEFKKQAKKEEKARKKAKKEEKKASKAANKEGGDK